MFNPWKLDKFNTFKVPSREGHDRAILTLEMGFDSLYEVLQIFNMFVNKTIGVKMDDKVIP